MRNRTKALLVAGALAALSTLVGCGGGGGGTSLNLTRVHADSGRGGTATIGPAGGTVTATGADGTVYKLKVPANALLLPTEISVYPVTSIDGLSANAVELTDGFAGGFHFTPEGLRFDVPATLTVQLPAGVDPTTLTAIGYDGDAEGLHSFPSVITGQTLTYQVKHFSGGAQLRGRNLTEDQRVAILTRWYGEIRPPLQTLSAEAFPDTDLSNYGEWRTFVVEGPWSQSIRSSIRQRLATSLTEADNLAAQGLRALITQSNAQCIQNDSVNYAMFAMRWQTRAEYLLLATVARQLDLATVLQNLCVKVKLDAQFPQTLQPNESGTLSVRAGYSINNGPTKYDQQMAVTVIPNFATDNTIRGDYVNDGQHTTFGGSWTRAAAANPLRLHVIARLTNHWLLDVKTETYLSAGSQPPDVSGDYSGTFQRTISGHTDGGPVHFQVDNFGGLTYVVSSPFLTPTSGLYVTWNPTTSTFQGTTDDGLGHWEITGTIIAQHLSVTINRDALTDPPGHILITFTGDKVP